MNHDPVISSMTTAGLEEKRNYLKTLLAPFDKKDFRGYREYLHRIELELKKRQPPVKKKKR